MLIRKALLILTLSVLLPGAAVAAPGRAYPQQQGWVNDFPGALEPGFFRRLDAALERQWREGGPELAVALVETVEPDGIEAYANALFNDWKLGRKGKDDGLLFILALKDKRLRVETGLGMEGVMPDGWVGRMLDENVVPAMRAGDLQSALWNGCDALLKKAGRPGLDPSARPAALPHPKSHSQDLGKVLLMMGIGLVFLLIKSAEFSARVRSGRHRGLSLVWVLMATLFSGSGRSGGGFSSGGFGGGGGGFSGGGGASRGW